MSAMKAIVVVTTKRVTIYTASITLQIAKQNKADASTLSIMVFFPDPFCMVVALLSGFGLTVSFLARKLP